jgi:predicted nucleic acid-binding protein
MPDAARWLLDTNILLRLGKSYDRRHPMVSAAVRVHGVTQLLTVNVRDFQRFKGLRAVHPAEVIHPAQQP